MNRWAPGAASRLHAAALELFVEHGFAATTVAQIAERAGLTTRSFFRYYADKREVLFAGEDDLPALVAQIFDDADAALTPMAAIDAGLRTVVIPLLEAARGEFRTRRIIVRSDEGLQERELRKLAILHTAATAAFARRGLGTLDADIAGRLAITVYDTTLELWLADGETSTFGDILTRVIESLSRQATAP